MGEVRTLRQAAATARARAMRRQDTRAEAHLWNALRAHRLGGWKWKRQLPVGPYFLDFACVEARIAVEVDGGSHADRIEYDARRTAFLESAGWRVIRFWNANVLTCRDAVCLAILAACGGERHLLSPERSERGRGQGEGGVGPSTSDGSWPTTSG